MAPTTRPPTPVAELRHTLELLRAAVGPLLGDQALADRLHTLADHLGHVNRATPRGDHGPLSVLVAAARAARQWVAAFHAADVLGTAGLDPWWSREADEALARVEAGLGALLREPLRRRIFGLYVIVDPAATGGRDPLEVARAALEGGARLLQLRDKARDKGEALPLARRLRELCRDHDALLIVNDHADLALAAEADGVHLGQQDLPLPEARRVLAPRQVAGRSNATLEEAMASWEQGADYVAVGAIYPTSTKERTRPAGLETLRRVRAQVPAPLVAIGGINAGNVAPVVQAGADAVCVISAVALAPDPRAAARELVARIREAGGQA